MQYNHRMSLEYEIDYSEILKGCSLNRDGSKHLRGYINGDITGDDGMPNNPTPEEVVVYRKKPELVVRERQITINILGLDGGRPYVNARLSRYSGENEIDWNGGKRPDGSCSTGRKTQTHSFPYLGRIIGKINQHVFKETPKREDGDPEVIADITRDGQSVDDLMAQVNAYVKTTGWCWVGVDAPPRKEDGTEYSVAEKETGKIRPYWQFYSPLEVLDWYFDQQGNLEWIKTQRIKYDDSNPVSTPKPQRVITLWQKGMATEYTVIESKDARYSSGRRVKIEKLEIPLYKSNDQPLDIIPFVLCGDASSKPLPFDDLESINRTIMDLGSVDRANFFNTVYPQLVLPASVMQRSQQDGYAKDISEVARLLLGFKYPITLDKDDPSPFYLTPDTGALSSMSERITGLKQDMFEVVGLALQSKSMQKESAAAKAWDNLDVAAVMAESASMLEDIETKLVAISKAWDDSFQEWIPVYNTDFDMTNFSENIQALIIAGNSNLPTELQREVAQKIAEAVNSIGTKATDERVKQILDSVTNWDPNEVFNLALPEP